MPANRATKSEREAVARRLKDYVKRHHGNDWSAFARAVGIARSTAINWRDAKTVPSGAEALKLAKKRISLDGLFAGWGDMERCPAPTGHGLREDLVVHLAARFQATLPRPTDEEVVKRTLPPPEVLIDLCVEFLRPHVEQYLPLVETAATSTAAYYASGQRDLEAEWAENEGFLTMEPTPLARERGLLKVTIGLGYKNMLAHMQKRARDGRPAYQLVDDRIVLAPLSEGQEAPPRDKAEFEQWLRWITKRRRARRVVE